MRNAANRHVFLTMMLLADLGCQNESSSIRDHQKRAFGEPATQQATDPNKVFKRPELMRFDSGKEYFWVLDTSKGRIRIRLQPEMAPVHVTSTIFLTNSHFYDDLTFHRVVRGAFAQGGCPMGDGSGGPGYTIESEITGSMRHDRRYLVGSANHGVDTDGSQFYITLGPVGRLDGEHAIFGEVVEGQDAVNAIESTATPDGTPEETITIRSASIEIHAKSPGRHRIRFDGLYRCRRTDYSAYLRFYPDGVVISVSSTGEPEQVAKWFTESGRKSARYSRGTYAIRGPSLVFSTTSSSGTVDFTGTIRPDALFLRLFSHINYTHHTYHYTFVPLDF
jgi:peptidyl-prolyl cis-trans isomerase B (cyclophilin B)